MKTFSLLLILLISCQQEKESLKQKPKISLDEQIKINLDPKKSSESIAVIQASLLTVENSNKYTIAKLKVNQILQNKSKNTIQDTISVASYSWLPGVPEAKQCIIYLNYWPIGSDSLNNNQLWMLLEGDGDYACDCK